MSNFSDFAKIFGNPLSPSLHHVPTLDDLEPRLFLEAGRLRKLKDFFQKLFQKIAAAPPTG